MQRAFVAASDDHIADLELTARDRQRYAVELAVGLQQCASAFVQRPARGVRARDHRIRVTVDPVRVPVGDNRVEGLPCRS